MSLLKVNNLQDLGDDPVFTNGVLEKRAMPSKSVLQVVSVAKTNEYTTASATFGVVTGLSVSITPSFTNSKILIIAQIATGKPSASTGLGHVKVTRGGTDIYIGDTDTDAVRAIFGGFNRSNDELALDSNSIVFLDSPATTSPITYQVEGRASAIGSLFINRSGSNSASVGDRTRGASSITVMEVAG